MFAAIYPNGAKMALGWPTGRNRFFSTRARGAARKTIFVFAGTEFGWIRLENGRKNMFEVMGHHDHPICV